MAMKQRLLSTRSSTLFIFIHFFSYYELLPVRKLWTISQYQCDAFRFDGDWLHRQTGMADENGDGGDIKLLRKRTCLQGRTRNVRTNKVIFL